MKLGLLLCDHVSPKYRERFGDYPNMFADLFPELEIVTYDATVGELPEDIDECEAYIGTGSKYSVYEDIAWIQEITNFVQQLHEAKKCFVGVCFSHQLIGHALGGKVEKADVGWCVGVHYFEPLGFNLLMMCQDQVTMLPPSAIVISGTKMCPNGMITIGKHILGIQAHPEFTKEYDRFLMENRVDRMGEQTVREGIESLELEVHRDQIREFILNFISAAT